MLFGVVAAGFGGAAEFDVALVFELFEPAFDVFDGGGQAGSKRVGSQSGVLCDELDEIIYSLIYSLIYSDIPCRSRYGSG